MFVAGSDSVVDVISVAVIGNHSFESDTALVVIAAVAGGVLSIAVAGASAGGGKLVRKVYSSSPR